MIKLQNDKNVGKVVYIVEGNKTEIELLSHIFTSILDYTLIQKTRVDLDPIIKYESKVNHFSKIYLINTKNSNLSSISDLSGREYLDNVYKQLFETFHIDLSDAATYYIFDRDPGSNRPQECKSLMDLLKSSRDNGEEANGLLLLSYPAIEAYLISGSNQIEIEKCSSAKQLKEVVRGDEYKISGFKEENIVSACAVMLNSIKDIAGRRLREKDLDDFRELSLTIFQKEQNLWMQEHIFCILSLLSVSFLDLGILIEETT